VTDLSGVDGSRVLVAGDLRAVFLPGQGMLAASLRHAGRELLRRVDDLDAAARKGSTAGIPLLHPWANRLPGPRYRAAGRDVALDTRSPLLHLDEQGLPIHGVPWARLEWEVVREEQALLAARLDWNREDLLRLFPFRHRVDLVATLRAGSLTLETSLWASGADPVPLSFGFHPYLGIPGAPRAGWRLESPPMRRLVTDRLGIPTGTTVPFGGIAGALGERAFDDGFALAVPASGFALSGGGWRIGIEFLEGFPYAQVFAPPGNDLVAVEPMTAPTGALATGFGLRLVEPGAVFRAAFRVAITTDE